MSKAPSQLRWFSIALLLASTSAALAAPPAPSGSHPRIFLSAKVRDAFLQQMAVPGSPVSGLIKLCDAGIAKPLTGSGYQGFDWSEMASACALAYQLTSDAKYATAGVRMWKALIEDIDTVGDRKACLPGVPEATAIASIRRDTGYAIRLIGPHTALAYDWLHDAPGVTEAFRQQTRDCFRHWTTYYTREGYMHAVAGANYNAGYVAAKALIAVAEGGEDGAASDTIWTQVVDDDFGDTLIGNGMAMANGGNPSGRANGTLVGGDWPEGWQYGLLSVIEYAYATRAIEEQGVDLAPLSSWASDLTLREIYSFLPDRSGKFVGGDTEGETYFANPATSAFDASRLGPSSDQAAGWASFMVTALDARDDGLMWQALADTREVTPADPSAAQLPLWYLARGTRTLYARSSWGSDAFWTVFSSPPRQVPDHQHMDASNFVFSRGGDPLLVDPSPYASRSSLTGNALTIDSSVVAGDYKPSQTPWSTADMPFSRGTASGVAAARADIAKAFNMGDTPSDVKMARRDWVFLPEGEIVVIDRATTPSASHKAYLRFRTPGTFAAVTDSPLVVRAPSGGSAMAVHAVKLTPATAPVFRDLPAGDCETGPFGACRSARNKVGEYSWEVAGPDILAIHVLDGLAAAEAPADVAPIDAAPIDDAGQNAGVVGASIYRAQKQTFVLEPATLPPPATLTYGVPGANASRHVVFDAPVDSGGHTTVTAVAQGQRCVLTLTAGPGITGAPAIFTVAATDAGCTVSEDQDVPPGRVSPGSGGFDRPGGGSPGGGGGGGGSGITAGCSCGVGEALGAANGPTGFAVTAALGLVSVLAIRRRRRRAADGLPTSSRRG